MQLPPSRGEYIEQINLPNLSPLSFPLLRLLKRLAQPNIFLISSLANDRQTATEEISSGGVRLRGGASWNTRCSYRHRQNVWILQSRLLLIAKE